MNKQSQPLVDVPKSAPNPKEYHPLYETDLLLHQGFQEWQKGNPQQALEKFLKASQHGNPQADYWAARCYASKQNPNRSDKDAYKYYKSAADKGYEEAYLNVARCYEFGIGVKTSLSDAVRYYDQGAKANNPAALFWIGLYYLNGWVGDSGLKTAFKFLNQAAEQNYPEAQYEVARCYELGRGVEKSSENCIKCLLQAAEGGHPESQFILGIYFQKGLNGLAKDSTKAFEWLQKSASQNFGPALAELGLCYLNGRGTPVSQEKAIESWQTGASLDPSCAAYMAFHLLTKNHSKPLEMDKIYEYLLKSKEDEFGQFLQQFLDARDVWNKVQKNGVVRLTNEETQELLDKFQKYQEGHPFQNVKWISKQKKV